MAEMGPEDRDALRRALRRRCTWLDHDELGPRHVEAGECDGCGQEARLVMTCGPGSAVYLGRRCAAARGAAAWCDGHAAEAHQALTWLGRLPSEADTAARLWWVATGEVRLDPALVASLSRQLGLPT
jgi:hypothetical protein